MSVQMAAEIWTLMRESVPYDDREQLADSLVGILMDHGFDLDDISYEFNDDADVQDAIKFYREDNDEEVDEYEKYSDEEDSDEY